MRDYLPCRVVTTTKKLRIHPTYWQANNLACYNFMDIGGRYRTPKTRTKQFIPHNNSSQSFSCCCCCCFFTEYQQFLHQFPRPISHRVTQSGPYTVDCVTGEEPCA